MLSHSCSLVVLTVPGARYSYRGAKGRVIRLILVLKISICPRLAGAGRDFHLMGTVPLCQFIVALGCQGAVCDP